MVDAVRLHGPVAKITEFFDVSVTILGSMTADRLDDVSIPTPKSAAGRVYGSVLLLMLGVPTVLLATYASVNGGTLTPLPIVAIAVAACALGVAYARPVIAEMDGSAERGRSVEAAGAEAGDPMAILRTRYAAGEVTDDEFERKLERLMATERDGGSTARSHEPVLEHN